MAGRFNSKFKKRTSHNTSNIKTSSSPIVSKPKPQIKTSRPKPVRTTPRGETLRDNPIVSALSYNPFLPEVSAEPYDPNIGRDDKFIEQSPDEYNLKNKSDISEDTYDGYREDPNAKSLGTYNELYGGSRSNTLRYNENSAFGSSEEVIGAMSNSFIFPGTPLKPFKDNKYEDLASGDIGAHTSAYTEGTSFFIDGDANNKDPSNIGFKEGEEIPKQTPAGFEIATVTDYLANDGQGETRGSYYKPGNATPDAHQKALDLQAQYKMENEVQSFYHKNLTAGNINDDMFGQLHSKIDKYKIGKDYKDELYSFYDTKRTKYKESSAFGGYEGFGTNTTHKTGKVDGVQASNWGFGNITPNNSNKAETTKAKIDKNPLSVSEHDFANYLVSTGQNTKPGGFDKFYNGTGTGFMDLTKINDKGNKNNKPVWFDYKDLGY